MDVYTCGKRICNMFRYFIDVQAGVVRVERLLFHRGGANNALPTAISHVVVYRDHRVTLLITPLFTNGCSIYVYDRDTYIVYRSNSLAGVLPGVVVAQYPKRI